MYPFLGIGIAPRLKYSQRNHVRHSYCIRAAKAPSFLGDGFPRLASRNLWWRSADRFDSSARRPILPPPAQRPLSTSDYYRLGRGRRADDLRPFSFLLARALDSARFPSPLRISRLRSLPSVPRAFRRQWHHSLLVDLFIAMA